jgi:uncharacterized protein (TIGR00369 family)
MTDTETLSGAVRDRFEEELDEHGLFSWLNLEFAALEPGRVVFEVPFEEKFANLVSGAVHGGVTASAMDTASAFALRSTFDDPVSAQVTTTDLDVRYVNAAREDLRVEATVVEAGGTMGYTDCEATTAHEGERKTVATGGTSYRLFRE